MSRHQELLERVRSANPVPYPHQSDPDELGVVLSLIDERRSVVTTAPMQQPERRGRRFEPSRPRRWRPVVAFGASLVLVLAAVGIIPIILQGGDTEPAEAPAVTVPTLPETASSATAVPAEPEPTPVSDLVWSRVPHDDAAFGDGNTAMGVFALAYGRNTWIAVGRYDAILGPDTAAVDRGAILLSTDGVTWERITGHEDLDFGEFPWFDGGPVMYGVAATDQGFVAVGRRSFAGPEQGEEERGHEAAVWTSPNGRSWTAVPYDAGIFGGGTDDPAWMSDVITNGDSVIAVGRLANAAAVWRSLDGGSSWSLLPHDEEVFGRRDTPDEESAGVGDREQVMGSVTQGPAGLVAVGADGQADGYMERSHNWRAAAWVSEDGVTWLRATPNQTAFVGEGGLSMNDVVGFEGGYVAVGTESIDDGDGGADQRAAAWFSPDGITWTRIAHDPAVFGDYEDNLSMSAVAVGPGGFVAVGAAGRDDGQHGVVWTSPNGIAWTRVPNDPTFAGRNGAWMGDVIATAEGFLSVGAEIDDSDWMYGGYAAVWLATPDR